MNAFVFKGLYPSRKGCLVGSARTGVAVAASLISGRQGKTLTDNGGIQLRWDDFMADKRNRADAGAGKREPRAGEPGKRRSRGGGMDERWLERKIRDMYQEVVDEPVPDDILKILNRIPKLG